MSFPVALASPKPRKFSWNQSFLPSATQANPISVSQVEPEEGGVWVTLGVDSRKQFIVWMPSWQVTSPSFHGLFWLMEFVSDCSISWNCRGSEQDGTELWSEQLHHTLVTFSKLLGLLVHLQVLNGLLWTSLARVCWNWESKAVRLFMEMFGRIQDICRESPPKFKKLKSSFIWVWPCQCPVSVL